MIENSINLNDLDKSDWETYRFDEIAQNISERVDPNNTDLEVYIGLEHIDSESLHIKRFGTPDDVNGQKLKFYKGDIIFGRRRAYQRKAGIATCDGFCSAHSLVLRADPDVIDPELFPFFMHSDLFMNRAIDISVGSLSPTINWGTLRHQEFIVPPKEMHIKLSRLLQEANTNLNKLKSSLDSLYIYRSCVEKEAFQSSGFAPLIKATEYFSRIADGTHDTPSKQSKGYKLLTSRNIVKNKLNLDTDYYLSEDDYDAVNKRSQVNINDILFGMIGTVGQVCRVLSEPDYAIKNMGLFKTDDEVKSITAFYYFKSKTFQHKLLQTLSGTTQKYVSLTYLRNLKLPDHNNEQVKQWIKKEMAFDSTVEEFENKIDDTRALNKSLINKVF